jgi:23S rRNA (guanosine2251-2'-O)-methyltransferase
MKKEQGDNVAVVVVVAAAAAADDDDDDDNADDEMITLTQEKKIKVVTKEQLIALVGKDAVHQGIVVDAQPLPTLDISDITTAANQQQLVVVLDCVSDPHNVGAILRSSAVFGASALITTERHSPKESATLAKTACGALEVVPMCVVKNLANAIKELKANGFWCVAFAEEAGKSLHQIDLTGKIALVLGAEGDGLRRLTASMCDFYVRLDAANTFSTLNVSNAAAIALYETFQQQKRKEITCEGGKRERVNWLYSMSL